MATFLPAGIQSTSTEVRQWTADFTDDLPTGITVTSGTATHVPPYGSAATPVVSYTSPYVVVTLPAGLIAGQHYLDVQATFSDGEKSEVRIAFTVNYLPTQGRQGCAELLAMLRGMTDTGVNDYTVANVPYWSDAQLQTILDRRATYLRFTPLEAYWDFQGGSAVYHSYGIPADNIELGSNLQIVDQKGNAFGTALWTFDQTSSIVYFAADMRGSAVFCNALSHDLNGAAADVWRRKAAHYATAYDIQTDNHNLKRSQLIAQCMQAAMLYDNMGGPNNLSSERADNINPPVQSNIEPDQHRRFHIGEG